MKSAAEVVKNDLIYILSNKGICKSEPRHLGLSTDHVTDA